MIFINSNGKMSTHIAQNVLLENYSPKKTLNLIQHQPSVTVRMSYI